MKSSSNKNNQPIRAAIVVGARPNFMKAAPLIEAMRRSGRFEPLLIHTGQHYDAAMSDAFFRDLDLPKPDVFLGVGSGTHAAQKANVMLAIEEPLKNIKPDLMIVVGDVNSTLAAALVAKKMQIPVAHVEAGLRSFDETMPEEVNRVLTDHISSRLFTTEEAANRNLRREGIADGKVHFVGNVMIDTLLASKKKIDASHVVNDLNLNDREYAVLTLHRPSNVDNKDSFVRILSAVQKIQETLPVVFPMHPRTRKQIAELGLDKYFDDSPQMKVIEPLGYIDFMRLVAGARFVMTDSGGLQEETTALKVPCLTLRRTTERPVTAEIGTSIIVGDDKNKILKAVSGIMRGRVKNGKIPKYWDGRAAERIIKILLKTV